MMKTKKAATAGAYAKGGNEYKGRSLTEETWRRLLKNKGAIVGMGFMIFLLVATIISTFAYNYQLDIISLSPAIYQSPSMEHIFGTDQIGRDIFARVIYGARYSLFISLGSVAIGLAVGLVLGSLAGFYGGVIDQIVMRANDILFAIPNIMIAIVIVSLLGSSTVNLLFALAIGSATGFSRIARASVMTIRGEEYVEAAYAMGLPVWKIILKHIIPNCLSPIIVQVTLRIGATIIAASSLSFLGVGVAPPMPEWGAMLADGRAYIRSSGWMCIFPGLAIMLTVLALNLLGDGLRDALDPKLKK